MARLSTSTTTSKPIFFDMLHSNNAARIRLWMALKKPGGMSDLVETRMIEYPDLKTPAFAKINPLKKVPGLVRTDGTTVFESNVILSYLEDKYSDEGASFKPETPEGRQQMELFCRIHDLYIASPNCTAPGFCHSQGAMYLSTGWHGPARGVDIATRAAKFGEIWKQLSWLEAEVARLHKLDSSGGPFMTGSQLTLADLTWFPTCVFMEYMLPRFYGWPDLFNPKASDPAPTPFPHLAKWYTGLMTPPTPWEAALAMKRQRAIAFTSVRDDIWGYWEKMDAAGQFQPIVDEIAAAPKDFKFVYGVPRKVELNYQEPPPQGKSTGRYINQEDKGDVVDEHIAAEVFMNDGRELCPPATLETKGFELQSWPTRCTDFADDEEVVRTYYGEMMELVKSASGAERVFIFDHTLRETGNTNLNAAAGGGAAAPVPRVHCDYTVNGAPRRLLQLGEEGIYSRLRGRTLTSAEAQELSNGRFAFINVWRSIDDVHPVMREPLAVCDENSVPDDDRFIYELRFPDRTGENYSLRHSTEHKWYYYPKLTKDECLVFKVYDKKEDGPRFVFHSAFDEPGTPADAPPRRSIEVRAIAFFDPPPLTEEEVSAANARTATSEPFEGR